MYVLKIVLMLYPVYAKMTLIYVSSRKSWHGKTNLPQNHKKTECLKPIVVNLSIYNRALLQAKNLFYAPLQCT